jgi:hypothetical protein
MTMLMAERVERPASLFGPEPEESEAAAGARRRSHDLGGGRLTLDEAIVGAWEGLAAQVAVGCPLCGGALRPRQTRDGVAGSCADCGTTLS